MSDLPQAMNSPPVLVESDTGAEKGPESSDGATSVLPAEIPVSPAGETTSSDFGANMGKHDAVMDSVDEKKETQAEIEDSVVTGPGESVVSSDSEKLHESSPRDEGEIANGTKVQEGETGDGTGETSLAPPAVLHASSEPNDVVPTSSLNDETVVGSESLPECSETRDAETGSTFANPPESVPAVPVSDDTPSSPTQNEDVPSPTAEDTNSNPTQGDTSSETLAVAETSSSDAPSNDTALSSSANDASELVATESTPEVVPEPPNPLDSLAVSTAPKLLHVTASRARGPAGGRRPPTRGVVVESKPQSQPDKPMESSRIAEFAFPTPSAEPATNDEPSESSESKKQKRISLGQPMMKFDVTGVKLRPSGSGSSMPSNTDAAEPSNESKVPDFRAHLRSRSSSNSDLQKDVIVKKSALPPAIASDQISHSSSSPSLPHSLPPELPPTLPSSLLTGGLPPPISSAVAATVDLPPPVSEGPSSKKKIKGHKLEKSGSKDLDKFQKKALKDAKSKEAKEAKDAAKEGKDKKKRATFAPTTATALNSAMQSSSSSPDISVPPPLVPAATEPATLPPPQNAAVATKKGVIASLLTSFFKSRPKREALVEKGLLAPEEAIASSSNSSNSTTASTAASSPNARASLALPSPIASPKSPLKKGKADSGKLKRASLPAALPPQIVSGGSSPPNLPPSLGAPPPPPIDSHSTVPRMAPPTAPPPSALPPALPKTGPPPVPSSAPPPLPGTGFPGSSNSPSTSKPGSLPPPVPASLPPPLPSSGPPPSLPPSLPPPSLPK